MEVGCSVSQRKTFLLATRAQKACYIYSAVSRQWELLLLHIFCQILLIYNNNTNSWLSDVSKRPSFIILPMCSHAREQRLKFIVIHLFHVLAFTRHASHRFSNILKTTYEEIYSLSTPCGVFYSKMFKRLTSVLQRRWKGG